MAARNSKFFRDFDNPWVRTISFKDLSAQELLDKVAKRHPPLENQGRESVWVFDLDSTLFCVGPRIRSIFLEFLRQHPQPPFEWYRAFDRLTPERQQYDIEATFRQIFKDWAPLDADKWARELWDQFRPFWEERFFIDRHMHHDLPYDGASDFVHAVRNRGYGVVYLTGRDRPRSGLGTLSALRNGEFPMDDKCHVFMKSDRKEPDVVYKHKAASVLRSRFEVPAFIDNEPENLVMFAEEFPQAEIVLFHTVMSHRIPEKDFHRILGPRSAWRLSSYA